MGRSSLIREQSVNVKGSWSPRSTFKSILEEYGVPYYLKIDIERADWLCVEGLCSTHGRPRFISIEIGPRTTLLSELKLLKKLGYTKFQLIDQNTVPLQSCEPAAIEGRYVDYKFILGMTGLFGRELPGRWTTARQIVLAHLKITAINRLRGICKRVPGFRAIANKHPGTWYDLHAAKDYRYPNPQPGRAT